MRIAKGGFFCLVMMSEFTALGVGPTGVYTQKNLPKWQIEMNERAKELEELQRKNGSDDVYVPGKVIDFPSTVDDLSFSARQQLTTESLEPFKNLKAYREINVKTASEWCSGEHSNTTECWEWRCSENNQNANKPICITYKCTKQDYYSAHKQECDMNKACAGGQDSTECMKYKCYNTDAKTTDACIKWLCENDSTYKTENQSVCDSFNSSSNSGTGSDENTDNTQTGTEKTECTSSDKNATRAEYDAAGNCIIKDCKADFILNKKENKCDEDDTYYELYVYYGSPKGTKYAPWDNECFGICEESQKYDCLNSQVLEPVLGARYCVPHVNMINFHDASIDRYKMKNTDTGAYIKIPSTKINDVIQKMDSDAVKDNDKCGCDFGIDNVEAEIYKCSKSKGKCYAYKQIRLDD